MVDLSETYSNNYSIIREYVKGYKPTPIKPTVDPSITDLSYDPNSTVKTITQQQKNLSELEIQTTKYPTKPPLNQNWSSAS